MMKTTRILLAATMAILLVSNGIQAEEKCDSECTKGGWVNLFDGKSLNGWIQHNGTAQYKVVDGTIQGMTNEGSPNSFLCTEKLYGNFELEFEVKVHDKLNSGVQIRSLQKNGDGRVYGPQVEIEATGNKGGGGGEAGYVYGEATGRNWLVPDDKRIPHKHFKDGQWNKFRIVANGNKIDTWINGNKIYNLVDEGIYKTHPKGFIGLQVHGIGKGSGPYDVAWKNIKLKEIK